MDFKFPDVGEGIHEGVIVKWHVKPGDHVKRDAILCEVETDKAVVEIPSPESAEIEAIFHKEGETVKVGEVLVSYKMENGADTKSKSEDKGKSEEKKDQGGVVGTIVDADSDKTKYAGPLFDALKGKDAKSSTAKEEENTNSKNQIPKILPSIRKLAKGLKVDIDKVEATGKNNTITENDVKKAAQVGELAAATSEKKKLVKQKYDFFGPIEYYKLEPVRQAIVRHLRKTWDEMIPVSQTHYCDVTDLNTYRKEKNTKLEKEGIHLTYLPFIFMALMEAVKEFPRLNAEWSQEFGELIIKKYVNLGFAVDTKQGLFVPTIRRADEKDIKTIAKEMAELVTKVKDRTIDRMDLQGATITVTNYGSIGTVIANPIIYYPNTCILGVGAIQKTPKLIDGKLEERLMMPLTLTYDHRFNDGADAARFLNKVIEYLEKAESYKL